MAAREITEKMLKQRGNLAVPIQKHLLNRVDKLIRGRDKWVWVYYICFLNWSTLKKWYVFKKIICLN